VILPRIEFTLRDVPFSNSPRKYAVFGVKLLIFKAAIAGEFIPAFGLTVKFCSDSKNTDVFISIEFMEVEFSKTKRSLTEAFQSRQ
jgi:hypothetical protein